MLKPVYSWLIQYIASSVNVDQREASRIANQIFSWRDSYGSGGDVLCSYTPRILLPIAHVLVDNWTGDDCLMGFSTLARNYGAPSLDPLSILLKYGLAEQYKTLVSKTHFSSVGFFDRFTSNTDFEKSAKAVVIEQEYDSRWLAAGAIKHILKQIKSGSMPDLGYYQSAKSAAQEALRRTSSVWKDEIDRYSEFGATRRARDTLPYIAGILREIVQYL